MIRLVAVGVLSAAFFSSTFILNRAMALDGGHWLWSAVLRYLYMLLFLTGGLLVSGRGFVLSRLVRLFLRNWAFWTLAGSTGFGVFYAMICFAASYAPGWVVATTWQTTILATPLVLLLFGRRTPTRALAFIALIFGGILLVNLELAQTTSLVGVLLGGMPVLLAAIAYPLGNQMVWETHRGGRGRIPAINDELVGNPFAKIFLLTLGSVPFWLVLLVLIQPPAPTSGQWLNTALVALFSGLVATGLFLYARQLAGTSYEISAVDATQSAEVVFSLLGEIIFLGAALPGLSGLAGVALAVSGLVFYVKAQVRAN